MNDSGRFPWRWVILSAVAVLLALPFRAWPAEQDELRRESVQEYPLTAEGGRISLENEIGRVSVRTWEESRVRIKAVKILDLSQLKGFEDPPAESFLDQVSILCESDSNSLKIRTDIPDLELKARSRGVLSACKMFYGLFKGDCNKLPLRIEYELTVPRHCDLKIKCDIGGIDVEAVEGRLSLESDIGSVQVRSTSGDLFSRLSMGRISLKDIAGSVDAKSDLGQVEAELTRLERSDRVCLESGMGEVRIALPGSTGADLSAESGMGEVSLDFGDSFKGENDWNSLHGKLNAGGAEITLKTGMGAIRIDRKDR